jgi:hypothetical protein
VAIAFIKSGAEKHGCPHTACNKTQQKHRESNIIAKAIDRQPSARAVCNHPINYLMAANPIIGRFCKQTERERVQI